MAQQRPWLGPGLLSLGNPTVHPTNAHITTKARKLAPDWVKYTHPNGSLYYHNDRRRITATATPDPWGTDAFDPLSAVALEDPPPDWEAYVETREKIHVQWIDHGRKLASAYDENVADLKSVCDDDLLSRSRYWFFIHTYPNHAKISYDEYYDDIFDALTWCFADHILFGQSNATFTQRDSKELIGVLKDLKAQDRDGQSQLLKTWFIACISEAIYSNRYYTRYGLHDASATRERERQETTPVLTWSWPFQTLYHLLESTLCFGVTHSYYKRIQRVDRTRFDDGVSTDRWQSFVSSLLSEWRDSNLVSTVLLSANISFLALMDIDGITRVLCLISIISSLGSVAFGSYLAWKHQSKYKSTAEIGLTYFLRARIFIKSSFPLAFVLSLPIVLLLWALLSFMAAVCEYTLRQVAIEDRAASHIKIGVITMLSIFGMSAILAWTFFHNVWGHRPTRTGPLSRFYAHARVYPSPHPDSETSQRFGVLTTRGNSAPATVAERQHVDGSTGGLQILPKGSTWPYSSSNSANENLQLEPLGYSTHPANPTATPPASRRTGLPRDLEQGRSPSQDQGVTGSKMAGRIIDGWVGSRWAHSDLGVAGISA